MIGVFGAARASQVAHLPVRGKVECVNPIPFPYLPGVAPAFTQHFATRWLRGGLPYTGNSSRQSVVELDMLDAGPASEAHVLAIADFIPRIALSQLSVPTAGSSLTWMLKLFGNHYEHLPLSDWRVDSEMVAARDGYTTQSNWILAPDGSLIALSRQSMVVFG